MLNRWIRKQILKVLGDKYVGPPGPMGMMGRDCKNCQNYKPTPERLEKEESIYKS